MAVAECGIRPNRYRLRRGAPPGPALGAVIDMGLRDAASMVNVGAGAGSYEPAGRSVVAVEPSAVMLAQHPGQHRVQAIAEALPFPADTFDAAMATVHHWSDLRAGLDELRRVAARQVVFTWDPGWERVLWVVEECVPEIRQLERSRFAPLDQVVEEMDAHTVVPFPDPVGLHRRVPAGVLASTRGLLGSGGTCGQLDVRLPGRQRHRAGDGTTASRLDLWQERHRELLEVEAVDYRYRLLIAG